MPDDGEQNIDGSKLRLVHFKTIPSSPHSKLAETIQNVIAGALKSVVNIIKDMELKVTFDLKNLKNNRNQILGFRRTRENQHQSSLTLKSLLKLEIFNTNFEEHVYCLLYSRATFSISLSRAKYE